GSSRRADGRRELRYWVAHRGRRPTWTPPVAAGVRALHARKGVEGRSEAPARGPRPRVPAPAPLHGPDHHGRAPCVTVAEREAGTLLMCRILLLPTGVLFAERLNGCPSPLRGTPASPPASDFACSWRGSPTGSPELRN